MKNDISVVDEISGMFNVSPEELRKIAEEELKKRRQRELLLTEPFLFHRELLCPPDKVDYLRPFHREGLEWLKVGTKRFKLILWPRGHLKTTLFTQGEGTREALEDPNIRILINSAKVELSRTMLTSIRGYLNIPKLQELYGELIPASTSLKAYKNNRDELTLLNRTNLSLKEATFTCSGLEASKTSQHYDLIFHDDLVNRENVSSYEMMDKVWKIWQDSLDLLEPDGRMIVLGTRWSPLDLYGRILSDYVDTRCFDGQETHHVHNCKCMFDVSVLTLKDDRGGYRFDSKFDDQVVNHLRTIKGSREFDCLPGSTEILMADWTTKPISEVKVGETLMGYDKHLTKNGKRTILTYQPAKVLGTFHKKAETQTLMLESGLEQRCTVEHRWYNKNTKKPYLKYRRAYLGWNLFSTGEWDQITLSPEQEEKAAWLAGILDGEGHCSRYSVYIAQSVNRNPEICVAVEDALSSLGLDYGWSDIYHTGARTWFIRGGLKGKRRFYLTVGVHSRKWKHTILQMLNGSMFKTEADQVKLVKRGRVETVYALETETTNYVLGNGLASRNSQYNNNPSSAESSWFKDQEKQINEAKISPEEIDAIRHKLIWYMIVDPAESTEKRSSYTAEVGVGVDPETGIWYVDRAKQERVDTAGFVDLVFSEHKIIKPHHFHMEKNTRKALEYVLKDKMAEFNYYFTIEEVNPVLGKTAHAKETRIRSLAPLFEAGRIKINNTLHDLISILLTIPASISWDLADVLSYILQVAPKGLGGDLVTLDARPAIVQSKGIRYAARRNRTRTRYADSGAGPGVIPRTALRCVYSASRIKRRRKVQAVRHPEGTAGREPEVHGSAVSGNVVQVQTVPEHS